MKLGKLYAFALVDFSVVKFPHLGALIFRVPSLRLISERENSLFALDFSSSRLPPPNAAVKPYFVSACFKACVFIIVIPLYL